MQVSSHAYQPVGQTSTLNYTNILLLLILKKLFDQLKFRYGKQ